MNTAGGNLPSADGAFERFLTAAIATIITIMFSWRLLTDVSDYDSAGCLLAAPPVGLKHLALNRRHESVDGDDEDQSEEEEGEEKEEEKKERSRKKKTTSYKAEEIDSAKNQLPGRFHTWGYGDSENLLDYEACLRLVQRESTIDRESITGLNKPAKSTLSNNNKKKSHDNSVVTYGGQEDKPNDRTHTEATVASVSFTGDISSQSSYLQLKQTRSTCASEGWLFDEKETTHSTDSNINILYCSPLEVKKEVSSIRGGQVVTKPSKTSTVTEISTSYHHNNGLTDTQRTSPSVGTTMESVSPLQQVLTPPLPTCVQGKSSSLITTTTATASQSINANSPSSSSSTGTQEKLYASPMTTTPTPPSCSSSLSSSHVSLPGRPAESGAASSHLPQQRDPRPKQPPPPPPPRKPSTSGAGTVINSSGNDKRLTTSTNIPSKTTSSPPILGRRTLSNNNNKANFANRNNPSTATASTGTVPTTTHSASPSVGSLTSSTSGEATPSLALSRVEGGCNREFRDIIDDDNFQQMMIPTQNTTTAGPRKMLMSGLGLRGRYHQPRLPPSYHQPSHRYDSDSDSDSESESEAFYFYGLEPIEEEDSDDLSTDSDHSIDYEVKGTFPTSITFDEHSKVDVDQLPKKRPPPLPPRAGETTENITCARIPQLPVRRKGMSAATTTTTFSTFDVQSTIATNSQSRLSTDSDSDDDDDDSSNTSSSSSSTDSSPTTSGSYSFVKVSSSGSSVSSGLPTTSVTTTSVKSIHRPLPGYGTSAETHGGHVSLFTVPDRAEEANTSEESCIDSSFTSTSSTSSATGSIAERPESINVQCQQVAAQNEANNPAGFFSVATIDPSPVIRPPPFLQNSLSKARTITAPCSGTSTTTITTTTITTSALTSDTPGDYNTNTDLIKPQTDSIQKAPACKPTSKKDKNKPALPPKPKFTDQSDNAIGGRTPPQPTPRSQQHKKVIITTAIPVSSAPSPGTTVTARPLSMTVGDLSDTSRDLTTYNETALLNFTSPERSTRVKDDYVKPAARCPLLLLSSQSRERSYSDGDVHTENSNIVQGPESHQAPFIEILESINASTRDHRHISSSDLPNDEFIIANGRVTQLSTLPPQSSPFYAKDSRAIKMYCDAQRSNAAENAPRGFTFSYTEEKRTDYSQRNYFMDNNKHETDSINNNTIDKEDNEDKNITNDKLLNLTEKNIDDISRENSLEINFNLESTIDMNINKESNYNKISDNVNLDNDPGIIDTVDGDKDPKMIDNIDGDKDPKMTDNIDRDKDPKIIDNIDVDKDKKISDSNKVDKDPNVTDNINVDKDPKIINKINVNKDPKMTNSTIIDNDPKMTDTTIIDNDPKIIDNIYVNIDSKASDSATIDNDSKMTESAIVDNDPKIIDNINMDKNPKMTDINVDEDPKIIDHINVDIDPKASDSAIIVNDPKMTDSAIVDNDPKISDNINVDKDPKISDGAIVGDDPKMTDSAIVDNDPKMIDSAVVDNDPKMTDSAIVDNDPKMIDSAIVDNDPKMTDSAIVDNDPKMIDSAIVDNDPKMTDSGIVDIDPKITDNTNVDKDPKIIDNINVDIDSKTSDSAIVDNDPKISDTVNIDNDSKINENIYITNDSINQNISNNNNNDDYVVSNDDDDVPSDSKTTNLTETAMTAILNPDKNHKNYSPSDMNILNTQLLDNGPVILKRELSLNEVDTTDTISSWSPEDDAMDGGGRLGELLPSTEDLLEDLPEEEVVPNNVCVLESGMVMRPPPIAITAKADSISTSHDAFNDSCSSGSENRYAVADNAALDSKNDVNKKPEELLSLSLSNGANVTNNQNRNSCGDIGDKDTIFSRELSNLDIDYEMFKMDCLSHSEDYASVYSLNKLGTCSSEGHLGLKTFTADSSAELDNSNNNITGEDFDQSATQAGGRRNLSQEEEEEIEDHLTDLNSDRFSPDARIYGSGRHYTSVLQRPLSLHSDQRVECSTGNKMPIIRRKINATRNRYFSADNVSDIAAISVDNGDPVSSKFARHQKATVRALKRRDAAKRLQLHVDTSLIPIQGLSASKSLGHLSQVHSRSKHYNYPEPQLPRPSYHEVHPDCILSPNNAEQLEESVRAASIDNLESCISRYGSITSLVETDLDTGETVERHFSFDFDVFEIPFSFQRSYFGKSASMMDLHSGQQQQQQQQVRHSTGKGRFADRHVPKSKSMQTLETNLDDDDEDDLLGESTFRRVPSIHELRVSRSLQKLNVPDWYKKSSVSRSGSCILNRDTDSMRSFDWRFTPSLTSSPASSIISQSAPVVIKTRVTPAYSRSLTTPMKAPKLTLPPKPANVPLPSDKFRTKEKPKGLMPIPIVPFSQIRDMFESKSRQQTELSSPSANNGNGKNTPIKTAKPEPPKRITPIKRSEHEVTPQPKKSPISQGFSPALRIEEAIEETNEEEEEIETSESGRNGVPAAHEFETIKGDTSPEVSTDHIITNGDSRPSRDVMNQKSESGTLLVQEGEEYRIIEEAPPMIRKPIARRAVPSEESPEASKKESPQVPPKPSSSAKPELKAEPVEISRREELAAATPIKTVKVSDRVMLYDSPQTSEKKEKEKEKEKERDWKPKLFNFRDSSKQAKAPVKQTPPQPPPRPKLTVPFFRSRKGKSDGSSLDCHSPSHSLKDPTFSTNPNSMSNTSSSSNNNNSSISHISSSDSPNNCIGHCNRTSGSSDPIPSFSSTNQSSCNITTISTSVPNTNTTIVSDPPLTNSSILHSNIVSHNNNSSCSSSSNNNNNNNNDNTTNVLDNTDKCSSEKNFLFEFLQKPRYDRHIGLPARPTSMEQNQSTLGQPNNDLSFRSPSQHSHQPPSSSTAATNAWQYAAGLLSEQPVAINYPPPITTTTTNTTPSANATLSRRPPHLSGGRRIRRVVSPANLAGAMGYRTDESASTALSQSD